jgi:hypothetical protein
VGAGPPNIWPGPRTFRVGPGRTSGHGPLALPVDSLVARLQAELEVDADGAWDGVRD